MSRYAGFRSDFEAWWALFFRTAGIDWKYEPQVYTDGVTRYLPDFWLPDQQVFFEVKFGSGGGSREDEQKLRMLPQVTGNDLCVAVGAPIRHPSYLSVGGDICELRHSNILVYSPDGSVGRGYAWCECIKCSRLDIQLGGQVGEIPCHCTNQSASLDAHSTSLHAAYEAVAAELARRIVVIRHL